MKTQIRNNPGMSSYFRGDYNNYGLYQWNIKYYDFQDNDEIEAAQVWAFGDYNWGYGNGHGFESINELLGRPILSSIEGRSGGWFVVDTELTEEELKKIDDFIASCMKNLPEFLQDERDFKENERLEREAEERRLRKTVEGNLEVKRAVKLLKKFAGDNFSLTVKGIEVKVL